MSEAEDRAARPSLWIGRVRALRPDRPARWFLHGYLA